MTDRPEPSPFRTSPKASRSHDKGRERERDTNYKSGPPNVDEMPVGGLGVYRENIRDYSGNNSVDRTSIFIQVVAQLQERKSSPQRQ